MSTEIAIYSASVPDRIRYCQALAEASLLPNDYRGKPANVLLALEYGAALGIAPMTAIQGVHVINGKPTASAGLIGALVRKAGHRLRVTGDDRHAVAEIVRGDDPEFTFRSEWTMERAQQAKLTGKDTWKNFPAAMLKARAITEVARDACPEALSGVSYTAEELGDDTLPAEAHRTDDGALTKPVERVTATPSDDPWYGEPVADVTDAVVVDESPAEAGGGEAPTSAGNDGQDEVRRRSRMENPDGAPTEAQTRMLGALLKGQTRDQALAVVSSIVGREVESRNELTKYETSVVIDALKKAEGAA